MKEYLVPVTWSVWGVMRIEANSLEEAKELAIEEGELPTDSDYIDDSLEIDEGSGLLGETEDIDS